MKFLNEQYFERLRNDRVKRDRTEKLFVGRRGTYVRISCGLLVITIVLVQYLFHHEVYQFNSKEATATEPGLLVELKKFWGESECKTEPVAGWLWTEPACKPNAEVPGDTVQHPANVTHYYMYHENYIWPLRTYAFFDPWLQPDLFVMTVFVCGLSWATTMRMSYKTMMFAIVRLQVCLLVEIYFAWFWFKNADIFKYPISVIFALMLVRTCVHTYDTTTTQVRIRG